MSPGTTWRVLPDDDELANTIYPLNTPVFVPVSVKITEIPV
jgi:hypothetical protein